MLSDAPIPLEVARGMNKRYFAAIIILAMVVGGLYALYTWPSDPVPEPLVDAGDRVLEAQAILARAETASREALQIRESLRREVRAREEVVHREVADYDADRIVSELNAMCGNR